MSEAVAEQTVHLEARQPPPPDYYAGNLRRLLSHVLDFHADLLEDATRTYARSLLDASADAQRLFARLVSRKGPWLRLDKLAYAEVGDRDAAVAELEALGTVCCCGPAPADFLLRLLTTAERRCLFPDITGARRAEWIDACVSRYPDARIRERLAQSYPWLALEAGHRFATCQTLFFGDDQQDTSAFVLQDLGLIRYPRYTLDRADRLFAEAGDFARYQRLRRLSALSYRLHEHAALAEHISAELWDAGASWFEQRQRDRVLNRLGQHFERRGAMDEALSCFARSRSHPARERRVRLLARLGDEHAVQELLGRMREGPNAAEEVDFAARFPRRRRRRPATTVVTLRRPELEERIERHAARLLSSSGAEVWHLENHLPMTLAGLAYWDVIMAAQPGAFVNPFQAGPLDLFWPDFAARREAGIAAADAALARPGAFRATVLGNFALQHGVANRLVSWRAWTRERLTCLLDCVPEAQLRGLARHVIGQPYRARTGFPDLVVIYGRASFEFVEVKGPTDSLQAPQRVWLEVLERLGAPARVLKFKA